MASSLKVEIVSAEKEIWSGEAKLVSASAQMGEVGIAPGHAPFITRIKPGEIRVKPVDDGEELDIYVSGGIMEVQPHIVTIMADTALRAEELDEASALKAKEEAEAALAGAQPGEIDFQAVQAKLAEASAQLQFIKKLRR
ncbi:F0F1 ATP synthase subunit epsilon [Granulosicoccus antarcticus]|uniref:ATP synthase epsilon chain n=1 Tax=Granulosicoccus antarcticus IMCC3135 TaxID=1192854 RepID=A0A2Z2P869_9GAMM|nr:F0F1 ATP synthase subunit epsilon [Granulosicoccus antarcticus]ASJ76867.1 ATP synthase epsilon chain [Granulosicoccus antarcticus IMCC3135]